MQRLCQPADRHPERYGGEGWACAPVHQTGWTRAFSLCSLLSAVGHLSPSAAAGVVLAAALNRTLVLPHLLLDGTQQSDMSVTEDAGAQHVEFR